MFEIFNDNSSILEQLNDKMHNSNFISKLLINIDLEGSLSLLTYDNESEWLRNLTSDLLGTFSLVWHHLYHSVIG